MQGVELKNVLNQLIKDNLHIWTTTAAATKKSTKKIEERRGSLPSVKLPSMQRRFETALAFQDGKRRPSL